MTIRFVTLATSILKKAFFPHFFGGNRRILEEIGGESEGKITTFRRFWRILEDFGGEKTRNFGVICEFSLLGMKSLFCEFLKCLFVPICL
mgnify:CR=1 FL=1